MKFIKITLAVVAVAVVAVSVLASCKKEDDFSALIEAVEKDRDAEIEALTKEYDEAVASLKNRKMDLSDFQAEYCGITDKHTARMQEVNERHDAYIDEINL